jgi:dTDP-4-amino-4,6-dideoxygalactose transaminase
MRELGVATQRHYRPLHLQPVYQHYNFYGSFPVAEHIYEREISIPMYYGLKDEEIKTAIMALERSLDRHGR